MSNEIPAHEVAQAWRLGDVYKRVEWHRANATQTLGALIPATIAAWNIRVVLEIGIANGFQTQCAALALASIRDDGILISCDISPQYCALARDLTKGMRLTHVVIEGDSTRLDWGQWLRSLGVTTVQLALIDGNHDYPAVRADLALCERILDEHGLIFAHDYWAVEPGVVRAVDEMLTFGGWQRIVLPDRDGGFYPSAILQRQKR